MAIFACSLTLAPFFVSPQAPSTTNAFPSTSNDVDLSAYLDEYSLLGVLDFLSFDDLVIVASMSPQNRQLILDHYITPHYDGSNRGLRIRMTEMNSSSVAYYVREDEDFRARTKCWGHECVLAAL